MRKRKIGHWGENRENEWDPEEIKLVGGKPGERFMKDVYQVSGKGKLWQYPSWNTALVGNKQVTKMGRGVTKFRDYQLTAWASRREEESLIRQHFSFLKPVQVLGISVEIELLLWKFSCQMHFLTMGFSGYDGNIDQVNVFSCPREWGETNQPLLRARDLRVTSSTARPPLHLFSVCKVPAPLVGHSCLISQLFSQTDLAFGTSHKILVFHHSWSQIPVSKSLFPKQCKKDWAGSWERYHCTGNHQTSRLLAVGAEQLEDSWEKPFPGASCWKKCFMAP